MSDMFGESIEKREDRKQSNFRKTEFLKLDEGETVIRILDGKEVRHYTHYMGWAYIRCLGDECPICENNKKLMYEHPEDFRDMKGWTPRRDRYYINVLDRTKGKLCEKCGTENSENLVSCESCGTALGDAAPFDKVKVLSGSAKLFEDLKVLANSVRDEQDQRVDIRTYDWTLLVRGKGRDKNILVRDRYSPAKAGFIELHEGQELFDLEKSVIDLTAAEMLDVQNGTSLKDIFMTRRASKQVLNSGLESADNINEEIKAAAQNIFKH